MITLFLDFLQKFGIRCPQLFYYTTFRMLMASVTCLLMTVLLGPRFIRLLYRLNIGQKIRKEECLTLWKLHEKKQDTPTMGGSLILISMLISLLFFMDLKSSYTLLLFITTIVLGLVGGLDDFKKIIRKNAKGLSGKKKLFFQILLGSFVALFLLWSPMQKTFHTGSFFAPLVAKEKMNQGMEKITSDTYASRIYIPFFKQPLNLKGNFGKVIAFAFMVFVIVGSSNAVNLTDGLDGLASGCLVVSAMALSIVAFISNHVELSKYLNILYLEGSSEIAIYMCALAGGALGFLWYNSYPAQIFMGDVGALSLGGILGVSSVLLKREFLLALIGGVFVLEALSVIIQICYFRYTKGKRFFLCAPFHHHFEYQGVPETKVVARFWIIALLFALLGLLTVKVQ